MLKKLSIALAQINAVNKFKNLWNFIHQIIYSKNRSKEVTKMCTII